MKVAHFIWRLSHFNGRTERFVRELTQWLAQCGHEMVVFTAFDSTPESVIKGESENGVKVHRLEVLDFEEIFPFFVGNELLSWGEGLRFFASVLTYNILAASELVSRFKKDRKFNVLHSHDWSGVIGAAGVVNEINLPLVFHIHSTEKGRSRGMGSKTIEALEYKGAKISDIVVTVSEAMRSELQALGMNGEKIRVVHNGVNASKFRPERVNPEMIKRLKTHYEIDAETILFVGRLAQVKGIHNLVMAMPEILKAFPKAKLIVAGTGELDAQLNFIIEHMGLEDRVIMKNENLDEDGRILHYAIADVCAFPSVYDPSGVACIEAMSMGKPVVVGASGTTGMREIVENNGPERCGIHVNGSDPSDIACGIIEVLNSERERKVMCKNARNRVLKDFTWDRVAERMLEVYMEACEMKNMEFILEPKEPPEQKQYQLQLQ